MPGQNNPTMIVWIHVRLKPHRQNNDSLSGGIKVDCLSNRTNRAHSINPTKSSPRSVAPPVSLCSPYHSHTRPYLMQRTAYIINVQCMGNRPFTNSHAPDDQNAANSRYTYYVSTRVREYTFFHGLEFIIRWLFNESSPAASSRPRI